MRPLELLFELPGLPELDLPAELRRLYDGGLGLDESCVFANFVQTIDGVVAIPELPRSNALIAGESPADRFVMGLLRACADVVLVARFDDHVEGVLAVDDRLAPDLHAELPDAGPTQVIEESGTCIGIRRGASRGVMLMAHHEESHTAASPLTSAA